jgi:DNA-binding XRE family transcriptional regulator
MSTDLVRALKSDDPDEVERICQVEFKDARESFSRVLPLALSGSRSAAFVYVGLWRQMKESVLRTLHETEPDLVFLVGEHLYVADIKRWPSHASSVLLDAEALEAPFSSWITKTNDVGLGACAALIQKMREITPGLHPIALAVNALPHWEQSDSQIRAFRRHVSAALNESDPALERIRHVFDLSLTQLGGLFGVSRQAVTQWLETGVPEDRLEKVATVASIADLFEYRLRTERIPGVVRREAAAYDGLTALEMIKENRQDELLASVRSSFEWAVPA